LSLPPGDPGWDACHWLGPIRAEALADPQLTWPRLMSGPHPRAVGSYGSELVSWAAGRTGMDLRWWQRLAALRLLEHDAAGQLVWSWWLVSTARQVGKSWLLRELLLWRIHQGTRFGEPQLVLHTGKDLPVCREVQRPARAWAQREGGYKVRESNGTEEIETADGSRWMIRGRGSIYGYSASLGAVDEAWRVAPEVVEDGLEPTMAERASAQLGLLSTAHRMATQLMPSRRAAAMAELAEPTEVLLLEWSAPADAELSDRDAWRMASPHWSERRARLITAQHHRAVTAGVTDDPDEPDPVESFRSQWLNIWPTAKAETASRTSPLLDDGAWPALTELAAAPVGALALAVDDHYGRGTGTVALARIAGGRVLAWGATHDRRSDAAAWLTLLAGRHPGSRLLVAPALEPDPDIGAVPLVERIAASGVLVRAGLALIRETAGAGSLRHDGSPALASQMAGARVVESASGSMALAAGGARVELVRALAAALAITLRPVAPAPRFTVR